MCGWEEADAIDLLSVALFIGTMVTESAYLKNKPKPDELSGTQLPPDALVPLGYERRDTTASLSGSPRDA